MQRFSSPSVSLHGRVANVLDYDIVVSKFELQSRYFVHFRTNHIYQPLRSGRIWHKVKFLSGF